MMTLNLIEMASKVDPMWLAEVAPHLVSKTTGLNPRYDAEKDIVVSTTQVFFNGHMVQEEVVADPEHLEAATVFARWLAGQRGLQLTEDASVTTRDLDAVLRSNAEKQEQARQMNIRHGEETFTVYSSGEMFERFVTALSGARRIEEVVYPEALALPDFDKNEIARVLSENPDMINILGRESAVEYRAGYTPRVRVNFGVDEWDWLQITNVQLPGGREVVIWATFEGWGYVVESMSSQFASKAKERFTQHLWDTWTKPFLPSPTESIAPMVEVQFSQPTVADELYLAYGVVKYDSWSQTWKSYWTRDRAEAEKLHAQAVQKFEEIRVEAQQKRELETAKAEAEAVRKKLWGFSDHEGWCGLDPGLRSEVEGRRYSYLPSSAEELRQYKADIEVIVTKVEAELVEVQRLWARRKEVEEQLNELRNLHGWPSTHIVVRDNGEVAVNCGKVSKLGYMEVIPQAGDRQNGPEALDQGGGESIWQPIPVSRRIMVRDYSSSGNLKEEVEFVVPDNLSVGVWAGTTDGESFYPVIHWDQGKVVLPEVVEVVSAGKEKMDSSPARTTDLSKLFGGNVRIR